MGPKMLPAPPPEAPFVYSRALNMKRVLGEKKNGGGGKAVQIELIVSLASFACGGGEY